MTRSIIRPDPDDGTVDDVVIDDVTLFRLERMRKKSVWLSVLRGDQQLSITMTSKSKITIGVDVDDFGCVDDTEEAVAEMERMIAEHVASPNAPQPEPSPAPKT